MFPLGSEVVGQGGDAPVHLAGILAIGFIGEGDAHNGGGVFEEEGALREIDGAIDSGAYGVEGIVAPHEARFQSGCGGKKEGCKDYGNDGDGGNGENQSAIKVDGDIVERIDSQASVGNEDGRGSQASFGIEV